MPFHVVAHPLPTYFQEALHSTFPHKHILHLTIFFCTVVRWRRALIYHLKGGQFSVYLFREREEEAFGEYDVCVRKKRKMDGKATCVRWHRVGGGRKKRENQLERRRDIKGCVVHSARQGQRNALSWSRLSAKTGTKRSPVPVDDHLRAP